MTGLIGRAAGVVLPSWAKWLALAALVAAVYRVGRVHEALAKELVRELSQPVAPDALAEAPTGPREAE